MCVLFYRSTVILAQRSVSEYGILGTSPQVYLPPLHARSHLLIPAQDTLAQLGTELEPRMFRAPLRVSLFTSGRHVDQRSRVDVRALLEHPVLTPPFPGVRAL